MERALIKLEALSVNARQVSLGQGAREISMSVYPILAQIPALKIAFSLSMTTTAIANPDIWEDTVMRK